MVEVDRLTYLKAMGITNYMPRWQLPGAPSPALCQTLPVAQEQTAPGPITPAPGDNASVTTHTRSNDHASAAQVTEASPPIEPAHPKAPAPADFAQVLKQPAPAAETKQQPENRKPPSQNTHSKEANKPQSAQNATQLVKFTLSFWRVSEELLVVDSRHSELALPTEKLLANLLFALGLPRDLPKPEVVQWPMIDAHHQDQGETAARETLNAFLDAQFLLNPGKYLLLMGREASHFILDTGKPYSAMLGHHFPVDEFNLSALVIPSLAEMLQDPAQKSLTWNTVKILRR